MGCLRGVSGTREVKIKELCAKCRWAVLRRGADDAGNYLYQFANTFTSRKLLWNLMLISSLLSRTISILDFSTPVTVFPLAFPETLLYT